MSSVECEARGGGRMSGREGGGEEGRNWAAGKPYGETVANHSFSLFYFVLYWFLQFALCSAHSVGCKRNHELAVGNV